MAEDNYKRLRAELDDKLKADSRLKAIAAKISAGTADFKDTSEYTRIVARYMGEVISSNIGSITNPLGKEMVCKALLRDEYESINGVLGEVQTSIDDKLGIHIKPVKPAFPTERVDKAAHSLEDPTVPESTIKRRARSTSENITNSFHDDYIKENAKLRSKAGLKCYITRETDGKCCPWCSGIAGRYEYGTEPHDIYRRHDNCGCSVTYENGRQRQDVWSKRTWEAPEPNAGAEPPKVFSREEAERLNAENMPKRLTVDEKSGIIHSIGDDSSPNYETYSFEPKVSKDVRTAFDDEYSRAVEKFGDITTVKGVQVLNDKSSDEGTYNDNNRFIALRHAEKKKGLQEMARIAREKFKEGMWSTSDPHHVMRHEIGHAIQLERRINDPKWSEKLERLTKIYVKASNISDGYSLPSTYSGKTIDEFISECIAAGYVKKQSKTVREVCRIINEGVIL